MMTPAAVHMNCPEPHRKAFALRAENEALCDDLAKLVTDRDYQTRAATFCDQETGEVNDE